MKNNWIQLLLCLALSSSIWLIHNLSQSYVSVVSVPVVARSNLTARAELSSTDATITAQVRATGFRHLKLASKGRQRPVRIDFKPEDFRHEDGDIYSIPVSNLYKYSDVIFGDGVSIESFVSDAPRFLFNSVTYKKVPVQRVQSISYRPQYMATQGMSIHPDSVFVYGETSRLDNIDRILTRPIELSDLSASAHGTVKLDAPAGVRLSDSEVTYSLEVSRYVEVRAEVKIHTRNVPSNMRLSVLPSTAEVVFRCVFPTAVDPSQTATFYVDYKDFASSLTGRCVARCDDLPSTVISYSVVPEVFDCIINSSGW